MNPLIRQRKNPVCSETIMTGLHPTQSIGERKNESKKLIGVIALAIMTAAVSAATIIGTRTQTLMAAPKERPGISIPFCESNRIFMYWHTENMGKAGAPDGWRVERRHRANRNWFSKSWEFTGAQADAPAGLQR